MALSWGSLIDLKEGYHQIRLAVEDQEKTAFSWLGERYAWKGVPFAEFQRIMENILVDHRQYTTVYLDDILVYSKSIEEHVIHVRAVIDTLTEAHLKVSADKCSFGYRRLKLFGHVVDGQSIRAHPERISAFMNMKDPKDVERLLGVANYLRDYIPLYSRIAAPLEKLRKMKRLGDSWTKECRLAIQALKDVLSHAPVITRANFDHPFLVGTDASKKGVGAVLYQEMEGKRHYIEFASTALTSGQCNYSATRRELLAIVFALKRFKYYLYGRHFTLFSDHRALEYLFTGQHENPMLNYWSETLLAFDFQIVHRPGWN